MNKYQLQQLVAQGEGVRLEFKRKANHPDKIVKEIVAFANTHGGKLLIGVDDDKSIVGLKYANEDEFVLKQAIEKHCKPAIQYSIEKILVAPNRVVLVFDILPSLQKPVFVIYNFERQTGVAYIRVADQSLQASREMRQILQGISEERSISFTYSNKEQVLLRYLAQYSKIDVKTYAQIAQLPMKEAAMVLVDLTIANVLKIQPEEMQDWFVMNPTNK
jgi:predicted HTH transcriptional regulator